MRHAFLVTVLLTFALPALPQAGKPPVAEHEHFGPPPPDSPTRWINEETQAAMTRSSAAWGLLSRSLLKDWRIVWDEVRKTPYRCFGPGLPWLSPDARKEEVVARSLEFVAHVSPLLGVSPDDLFLAKATRSGGLWVVIFHQTRGGFVHAEGRVDLRFDGEGRLVLFGGTIYKDARPDLIPAISAEDAAVLAGTHLLAQEFMRPYAATIDLAKGPVELVATATGPLAEPVERLAYKLSLQATEPPAVFVYFVDALTGDVLRFWNDIRHFQQGASGSVNGLVHNNLPPQSAPVSAPLTAAEVLIGAQTLHTNSNGNFSTPSGSGTLNVSSWLRGYWARSLNSAGTTATFATTMPAGGNLAISWTDANSTQSERDVYFFVTKAHDWLKTLNASDTTMDFQITCNCNVATTVIGACNAFYDPSGNTLNLITSGGGCVNMGTVETVVTHEYGHAVSTLHYSPFSVPGHLGEGLADVQAGFLANTSIIGLGWMGTGTSIRNIANSCQYPASCGTEIHVRGLVIGGAFWSTRLNLEVSMGTTAGRAHIGMIYLNGQNAAPQDEPSWAYEALLLDDNDGNLANGTPHVADFYNGFTTAHGIPFPLSPIAITHNPVKNNQGPFPYEVRAQATPVFSPSLNLAASRLWYRVNSGSWQNVALSAAPPFWPNTYRGYIPNQLPGARIDYYFRFVDSANAVGTSPPGAPNAYHTFGNFRETQLYNNTFEANNGSFTHGLVAGQDDWQWGIQYGTSPNDPPSAWSGTKCWGNDLGPTGWNGDYAANVSNWLQSPAINATGQSNLRLKYRRWLTVEDAVYDQARILVNTTQIWQNPVGTGSTQFLDTAWVLHDIALPATVNNTSFTVRYELVSDPGLQYGGWNIDDLSVVTTSTTPILQGAATTTVGSVYNLTLNGPPGGGLILLIDFASSPVYVEGAGTIALSLSSGLIIALYSPYNNIYFPASGQINIPVGIPPILAGTTLYLQAAVYPLTDLTNLTLSNLLTVQVM